MSEVLISKQRLRELEATSELGVCLVAGIDQADGNLILMLENIQAVLTTFMARVAIVDAMKEKA